MLPKEKRGRDGDQAGAETDGCAKRSGVEAGSAQAERRVPLGARKGAARSTAGRELYQRLKQHSSSIEHVENLRLEHFRCRYLVVVPVWITLAERFLVEQYRPLWNVVIDGFGNHDPGGGKAGYEEATVEYYPSRPTMGSQTHGR